MLNTEQASGMVFDIQRFSIHDGPGVRTTVFLKGCPLQCTWCHNPESWESGPELMYDPMKCNCGGVECAKLRERFDAGKPMNDEETKKLFVLGEKPTCAGIKIAGWKASVTDVIKVVERDRAFYQRSGGGMTVSGGEALAQKRFTLELFDAAHARGWHTTLETCGFASESVFREALDHVDLVLFDLKEMDPELHVKWTGVPLEPILKNLRILAESKVDVWVRMPVIPLFNDHDDHWRKTGEILSSLPRRFPVHLLPYHSIGIGKSKSLGKDASVLDPVKDPDADRMNHIANILASYGVTVQMTDGTIISKATEKQAA
jgi:pyruvate formate lyase activating enzyme